MKFLRYPRTPHLQWVGNGRPRDDKVLSRQEARELLAYEIIIEEKVDGANVGLRVGENGLLRAQSRGEYLRHGAHPQFEPLWPWLDTHAAALREVLGRDLILFGEWCFAVHSVRYDALPDWFLAIDVYDRRAERFWSVARRNALVGPLGISTVPTIRSGRVTLDELRHLLATAKSRFTDGPVEGLYLRVESQGWLERRAKLVRPEFLRQIDVHWSARRMERNRLASEVERTARHGGIARGGRR